MFGKRKSNKMVDRLRRVGGGTILKCTAGVLVGASLAQPQDAYACGGPPPPPMCARTNALVKAAPVIVVLPATPAPVSIAIPVTVVIASIGACPAPVSTTFTLTGACVPPPSGAGALVLATPATGAWPTAVVVTFPAGPARACLVSGTAATLWADGVTTTATGDTLVCLVDAAPGMPGVPRLDMELLTPAIQVAHPGDQRIHRYRLTNNDPTESVTIGIDVDSEQTARLPTQTPPPVPGSGDGPFGFSDPATGDNFPIAFGQDLLQAPVRPNNYSVDDGSAVNGLGLGVDAAIVWMNQFDVLADREFIDRVSVGYGPGADGQLVRVCVWDDPNNDGNPSDAVLLTQVDSTASAGGTDTFIDVLVPPTDVGSAGDSFFVGVVMQESPGGALPAAHDPTTPQGQSWIGADAPCGADAADLGSLVTPMTAVGSIGFPGNFLVRAHGSSNPLPLRWVELPPDPTAFGVPTISQALTLCPGESRVVEVAQRSWPMCRSGSCGESRIEINGTFSDGTDALACGGAAMRLDSAVPPDFQCPDGGVTASPGCLPFDSVHFVAEMPTHVVEQTVQMTLVQILPLGFPPLVSLQPQCSVSDQDAARLDVLAVPPGPGPALQSDQPFIGIIDLQLLPRPEVKIETEILELMLHSAPPVVDSTYFYVNVHQRVTGPSIPPTLDSFFDVFYSISLDGHSGLLHRPARIDPSSIQAFQTGPQTLRMQFQGTFPSVPGKGGTAGIIFPPFLDSVTVQGDFIATATGLTPDTGPDCPADLDGDGDVDGVDLGILLANWSIPPGAPGCGGALPCPADIDGDGDVDGVDLGTLLANWSIPPGTPGCS